jgi:hypothetical protein
VWYAVWTEQIRVFDYTYSNLSCALGLWSPIGPSGLHRFSFQAHKFNFGVQSSAPEPQNLRLKRSLGKINCDWFQQTQNRVRWRVSLPQILYTAFQWRWEVMYTKSSNGKCCYRYLTLSLIRCHLILPFLFFFFREWNSNYIMLCSDNDLERHIG